MPWKKLNSPPRTTILRNFKNQEYRFIIPKSRIRLAEKREEEEDEHRQLRSVLRFTQTQKMTHVFLRGISTTRIKMVLSL